MEKIFWAKPCIEKEEISAITNVAKSKWLTQGPVTQTLEKKISQYVGCKHAVVVNNGTSALICSLLSHGIGKNDEVIVPSFTFAASVNSILAVGAKPVLIDCNVKTFNVETDMIKKKISHKTKAILPVDVSGMPVNIEEIKEIATKNNLFLIEDAAEGIGAKYKNKKIGSFGHSTIFSFHMAKVVAGIEGGCILTNDSNVANKLKLIRSHGDSKQYLHKVYGLNFRISDIHSAMILAQLKRIDKFLKHRNKLAKIYKDELNYLEFQAIPDYVSLHPFMLFAILISKKYRNSLNNFLQKNGIETRICWLPVHKQPFHSTLFDIKLKNSEEIYSKIINLPMGNCLTENDVIKVINVVKKWKTNKIN